MIIQALILVMAGQSLRKGVESPRFYRESTVDSWRADRIIQNHLTQIRLSGGPNYRRETAMRTRRSITERFLSRPDERI
jgi:hypothetical protein